VRPPALALVATSVLSAASAAAIVPARLA